MLAEILATGDEIRTGALVDSNSAHIAEILEENGIDVTRHTAIGDDMDMIVNTIKEISMRTDVCIATGGLGPTMDDLTSEAAATAAGVGLVLNPKALEHISGFFRFLNRPMSESNKKQAFFPETAHIMDNPVGTAPGFHLTIRRCRFFFLPGVPGEMRRMLNDHVMPFLQAHSGHNRPIFKTITLSTFGLPESAVNDKLCGFESAFPALKLGLRAKFPEIQIKLYRQPTTAETAAKDPRKAVEWIRHQMGDHLIAVDGKPLEAAVTTLLIQNKQTVAIAESCTGGLISHLLTNTAGSSACFLLSAVTYADTAKERILGVPHQTIASFGAVSEQTAVAMAHGVRNAAGSDFGLATTGIAGPDGGTGDKPVGTVWIAVATPTQTLRRTFYFPFGDRAKNKTIFAYAALEMLRRGILVVR